MRGVQTSGRRALLLGAVVAASALTGCVVAPADPYYYGGNNAVVVASEAPPPVRYEAAPVAVAPIATQVWIGGFWDWSGGRYQWREGHWATPPSRGAHWVPREWVRGPRGWQARGGHWDRR